MSSCEESLSDDGLQEICMQNEHVRLSVLPEAGGKIDESAIACLNPAKAVTGPSPWSCTLE